MDDTTIEKIYKSSLKFLAPSSIEEVYSTVVEEAIKLVGADSGAIYLQFQNHFKPVYSSISSLYNVIPRRDGNTYKSFMSGKTIIADVSDVGVAHPEVGQLGVRSSIFIPLSYKKQTLGVLTLNTKKPAYFDSYKLKVLILFGSMVTLAIKKAQLYEEAKSALETRDLFISMASHELRTPLTAINGYSQLLSSRLSKTDTPEARWVNSLAMECSRMTNLVKELLTISQIRGGGYHYSWKECSLREIVNRVTENFRVAYPERSFVIDDKIPGTDSDKVVGDYDKLIQGVTNLLDNAAKFSPGTSEIILTLKSSKSSIEVQIKDHGIGIDSKDLPNVFDKYYLGSDHRREGMGLGLFLAKDIFEKHHGSIAIKTKKNKGTAVNIKLPIAQYA